MFFFGQLPSPLRILTPARGTGQIISVFSKALGVVARGTAAQWLPPWAPVPPVPAVQDQSLWLLLS